MAEAIGKREKKRFQFNLILLMPLVLIVLLACTTSQSAAETKKSIPNPSKDRILTSKLYSECRMTITDEHFEKSFCNGYIDGAFEGMASGIFFTLQSVNGIADQRQVNLRNRSTINVCWPHGKRPPNIKIAQQFIGWAKSHKRELFYPESAISGLIQSQRLAFPCPVNNQQ